MDNEISYYDLKPLVLNKIPREQQVEVLDFVKESILSNKKYIQLEMPTGSGKSIIAVMIMDWFKHNYDISAQFDILTNSKILQEQYTNEFDFMNSLWGKGSYQCEKYNTDCGTGSEWCKIQNSSCDNCPYSTAKYKFENGDIALTNYHLFLTYKFYMPNAWKRRSRMLIIDESHSMIDVVSEFISTKINKHILKKNGFTDKEINDALKCFGKNPEILSADTFVNIVNTKFLSIVKTVINRLASESNNGNLQSLSYLQSLNNNYIKWELLYKEYNKLKDNWIVEIELIKKYNKNKKLIDSYYEFIAQPIWAYPYMIEKIWDKYDFIIFMSGTILDQNLFSKLNGLDNKLACFKSISTTFPIENRPIYYFSNIGKMSHKTKEIIWKKQIPIINKILNKHKNSKGIIHTSTYELQQWLLNDIKNNRILTHDNTNRNEILQQHFNSDKPTILASPSLTEGIDLKDDYSRHQTIIKIPYPNMANKKVKKQMESIPEWYKWKTVCTIIQALGRSNRHIDDKSTSYIIDGAFSDVLKWSGYYFPEWFKNAIIYVN